MKNLVNYCSVVFLIFYTACFNVRSSAGFNYTELTQKEFNDSLSICGNCVLIDVRTPKEFEKSHIPGAVNISYFGSDFKHRIDSIPREKTVFMYCQTQHRSPLASKIMRKMGFNKIVDLKGGYVRYKE